MPQENPEDALEPLMDMTGEYGYRPVTQNETEASPEELAARLETAPGFIDSIVAFAEPEFVRGNHIAVAAAMMEGYSWLDSIEDFTMISMAYDDDDDDDENNGEDESEERRGAAQLRRATERLASSASRYEASITAYHTPHSTMNMTFWREIAAGQAFAAMLNRHTEGMQQEETTEAWRASGHNLAAYAASDTLTDIKNQLDQMGPQSNSPHRKGNNNWARQAARSLEEVTGALRAYDDAEALRQRTTPIRIHEEIGQQTDVAKAADELAGALRDGSMDQSYLMSLNSDNPRETLIAYRDGALIRVQRATDHYPQGTSAAVAQEHAAEMLKLAENADDHATDQDEPQGRNNLRELAQSLALTAAADLHTVNRRDFRDFVQALKEANDDPNAVINAALEALGYGRSSTDLLFEPDTGDTPLVTRSQTEAVIKAAEDAGIKTGIIRAICAAMTTDGRPLTNRGPRPTPHEVITALDMCPVGLLTHQATAIARALGMREEMAEVVKWMAMNCMDSDSYDQEDDEDYEEDED